MLYSTPISARLSDEQGNKLIITSASEALILLTIDNNHNKWPAMHKWLKDNKDKKLPRRTKNNKNNPDFQPLFESKYTTADGGQKPFGGWSVQGKKLFIKLKKQIKEARKQDESLQKEKQFLEILRKEDPKFQELSERPTKRAKKMAEVADTVDDDDFEQICWEEDGLDQVTLPL
jgi:hypothetical protein